MRIFVGTRFEQVQFGFETFHVGRQLGDLALLLFDGCLESCHLVASFLVASGFVVIPDSDSHASIKPGFHYPS